MRYILIVSAVLFLLSEPPLGGGESPGLRGAVALAQMLPAATFLDQIDEAARYVRAYGQDGVDDQPWDVSVKAVAHYPAVLDMMADKMDWTTALGQAYVNQSTDVMESVQRLRAMANAQGNLVSTPEQEVIVEPGYYAIWPANPQCLYVPFYDPMVIFFQNRLANVQHAPKCLKYRRSYRKND